MTGAERIAAERARQVEVEGWTAHHDDTHHGGDMALASACYAVSSACYAVSSACYAVSSVNGQTECPGCSADLWPWGPEWDKRPRDEGRDPLDAEVLDRRIRALEKSGALAAAEIDRLLQARGGA